MTGLMLALLLAQTAAAAPPAWTYKEATDANGKKSATAAINAEDGSGRLIVRCDTVVEPIVSVQYIPRPRLPASEPKLVRLVFDDVRAETATWEFPGAGAYNGMAYDVFMVASKIAAAKSIVVVTENAEHATIQSEFLGPGSDALFRKVYAACGRDYALPVLPTPSR